MRPWMVVAALLLIEVAAWIVGYWRSTETGRWRLIDANLMVIATNLVLVGAGAIVLIVRLVTL